MRECIATQLRRSGRQSVVHATTPLVFSATATRAWLVACDLRHSCSIWVIWRDFATDISRKDRGNAPKARWSALKVTMLRANVSTKESILNGWFWPFSDSRLHQSRQATQGPSYLIFTLNSPSLPSPSPPAVSARRAWAGRRSRSGLRGFFRMRPRHNPKRK